MNVNTAVNLEDLRLMARRKLPRIAFDFIDGGVDDEDCMRRNREAFRRYQLVPRYLVDVTTRDQSTELLGRRYASPFGISPTGLAGLFHPGADELLAQAAKDADIPFLLSSASNAAVEMVAKIAPDHVWFQTDAIFDNLHLSSDALGSCAPGAGSVSMLGLRAA